MKKLLLFLLTVSLFYNSSATHNRGGEIYYKRIAPFTNIIGGTTVNVYTYSITLIKYTNHGAQVADRCIDTLYFGDGTKSYLNRTNTDFIITCACMPNCGEQIINLPGYVVKKNVYSTIHTYPGTGNYIVSASDRNRNESIVNVPNSVNQSFYIEALLMINSNITNNSSPILFNPPIGMATNVNCFYHQPLAYDADGDSLSYELIACKGFNGQNIVGYTYPPVSPNGYFFMDYTGLVSWCNPPTIGEYNIAFYVKEWRKNTNGVYQLIGMIERDMQIIVQAGILGLDQFKNESMQVNVGPVPFHETLKVSLNDELAANTEASLFSLDGQLLQKGNLEDNAIFFATKNLAPGFYIIAIKQGQNYTNKKVLKD
jgi:hypothetical protein